MPRYIAFLRAINVGGHTVKMDSLRRLFEALGFASVATFIASGNVIFEAPARSAAALEKKIEARLHESLGYEVATFLRTPAEVSAIAAYRPFPAAEIEAPGHYLYVGFLAAAPSAEARKRLAALRTAIDEFHVHEREFYWLCRTRSSESTISGALLERTLGLPATMRNSTTIRKLAAKYPPAR
jgi:uncharacterized protein (DUF1697 family)